MAGKSDPLKKKSTEFCNELNSLVASVFPSKQPKFKSRYQTNRIGTKSKNISIGLWSSNKSDAPVGVLSLEADGRTSAKGKTNLIELNLEVSFDCKWSSDFEFLAVHRSNISVFLNGTTNPLFRYEFDADMNGFGLPAAHIQVHAHRDEIVWLLMHSQTGRPKDKWSKDRPALVSSLHFPVGGNRFRPALEDVLTLLNKEFGVKFKSGAEQAIGEHREIWRLTQLRAAVNDAQTIAADELKAKGWKVEPPVIGAPSIRKDRLQSV